MKNNYFITGALVCAVITLGIIGFTFRAPVVSVNPVVEKPYGAIPGPDVYFPMNIHDTFTYGGKYLATTTASVMATTTLSYRDLNDNNYLDVVNMSTNLTGRTADFAYLLPATSTMNQLLPDIGSTRSWLFHNATSSALTFTIDAPTGIDLVGVTVEDEIIDSGEWMQLTCTRIYYRGVDNENVMCIVDELINVD